MVGHLDKADGDSERAGGDRTIPGNESNSLVSMNSRILLSSCLPLQMKKLVVPELLHAVSDYVVPFAKVMCVMMTIRIG